jgi:predicted phage terminase large subunit-like protein
MTDGPVAIKPQPGPQTAILQSSADVAIYGGAAGGGKSWAMLVEPLRHIHRPGFHALILRKTTQQVRNQGGLWDQSQDLYRILGGRPREHTLEWRFPSGATVKFGFLEHEKDKFNYHGAELGFIGFDELTEFSESQFWYLFSRNRTTSGMRPYIRATTNPDADSWVARLIDWYIDQDTGYPIPNRSGIVRHFTRRDEKLAWSDDADPAQYSKSFTFVPASLDDNRILVDRDPGYRANLLSMALVDRERLLRGNWKIRHAAGNVFRPEWFRLVGVLPRDVRRATRYWDKAGASELSKDGDYSCGVLVLETMAGRIIIGDVVRRRLTPHERNKLIYQVAQIDARTYGERLALWIEREPGHNATESTDTLAKLLREFGPRFDRVVKSKLHRATTFAAAAESGIVDVLNAAWTRDWLDELAGFPDSAHDDQVDASAGGFVKLTVGPDRSERMAPSAGPAPRR